MNAVLGPATILLATIAFLRIAAAFVGPVLGSVLVPSATSPQQSGRRRRR
jgi:hypothetical protein